MATFRHLSGQLTNRHITPTNTVSKDPLTPKHCGTEGLQVLTCHVIVFEVMYIYGMRWTVEEEIRG